MEEGEIERCKVEKKNKEKGDDAQNVVEESFLYLASLTSDLYIPREIERITKPSSTTFLREYVNNNIPVIITGVVDDWKAYKDWDFEYLISKIGEEEVTVSQTPHGRADSITHLHPSHLSLFPTYWEYVTSNGDNNDNNNKKNGDEGGSTNYFITPHDQKMKFSEFVDLLRTANNTAAHYIQYQNSNFTSEFEKLADDINSNDISFAFEAFNASPDATNLWIGNYQSVSSLHKDNYENIYIVLRGEKVFTLFPPTDRPFLYEKEYPTASFYPLVDEEGSNNIPHSSRRFGVTTTPETKVPWISVNPDHPDFKSYPLYVHAHPIEVRVKAGEILYLPSLWYHQVAQEDDEEGKVIALNYWFDMIFSLKYAYFSFVDLLAKKCVDDVN